MNTNQENFETIVSKLRERRTHSQVFRAMLSFFEKRQRGRQEINIVRLKRKLQQQGVSIKDGSLAAEFRALQDLGLGRVVSHKDQPSKFLFSYNLRSIATAANGRSNVVKLQRPKKFMLPTLVAGQPVMPEAQEEQVLESATEAKDADASAGLITVIRKGVEYRVPEHIILKLLA